VQAGYKVVLALAAISTLGVIALPRLAKTQDQPLPRERASQRNPKLDRIVRVHFDHATVDEVLNWLTSQGVNYVVRDPETKDVRVSMNIEDRPLYEVVHGLADALGGSWRREGETNVFQRTPFADFDPEAPRAFKGQQWDEFGKKMGDWGRRFGEEFSRNMPPPVPPGSEKDWEHFGKKWEKWGEEFGRKFEKNMKNIPPPPNAPDVDFDLDMGTPPPPPDIDEPMPRRPGEPRVQIMPPRPPRPGGQNLKRLIHSLSAEQRAKAERQGYLTPMDLTEEQVHMLGGMPTGDRWTLNFQIDGEKLEIRNR